MSINEHPGRRAAAKVFDLLFIRSEELVDVGSGSRRLICCIPYTLEEEVHPCGPTLILALFAGLRLFKLAVIAAAVLLAVNYAVLIPFGYGDHMAAWLETGRATGTGLLGIASRLAAQWSRGLR